MLSNVLVYIDKAKQKIVPAVGGIKNFNRIIIALGIGVSVFMISDGLSRYYDTVQQVTVANDALSSMQNSNNQIQVKIDEMKKELERLKDKGFERELFKNTSNVSTFVEHIKSTVLSYHAKSSVKKISYSNIDETHKIYGIDISLSVSFPAQKHGTSNFYKMDKILRAIDSFPMKKEISEISINTVNEDVASASIKLKLWSSFKYE